MDDRGALVFASRAAYMRGPDVSSLSISPTCDAVCPQKAARARLHRALYRDNSRLVWYVVRSGSQVPSFDLNTMQLMAQTTRSLIARTKNSCVPSPVSLTSFFFFALLPRLRLAHADRWPSLSSIAVHTITYTTSHPHCVLPRPNRPKSPSASRPSLDQFLDNRHDTDNGNDSKCK